MKASLFPVALVLLALNVCHATSDDRTKALEVQAAMRRELGSSSSSKYKGNNNWYGEKSIANTNTKHELTFNLGTTPKPKPKHHPKPKTNSSSNGSSTNGDTTGDASGYSDYSGINTDYYDSLSSLAPPSNSNNAGKMFGVAAAGAILAAAAFNSRRQVATEAPHPLAGSIAKRVENFEKFAGPHTEMVRPTTDYDAMPDGAAEV